MFGSDFFNAFTSGAGILLSLKHFVSSSPSSSFRIVATVPLASSSVISSGYNWCTLYPEEITELLASGTVATIRKDELGEDETKCFRLSKIPAPLVKALKKSLPNIRTVEVAYVAGLKQGEANCPDG